MPTMPTMATPPDKSKKKNQVRWAVGEAVEGESALDATVKMLAKRVCELQRSLRRLKRRVGALEVVPRTGSAG